MTGLVLVVDDVPANVKLLDAKLTNEYYDVVTAKDGFEAIKQAKAHKPDLILLDVMMPGMDGFETCKQLKKDPDVSHIPVVMVTALSEPSDRVQGLESGADDFITKPINDTALFARVKSLIRIKVLIDELRLRGQSGNEMGVISEIMDPQGEIENGHVVVIDDDAVQSRRIKDRLSEKYQVEVFADYQQATNHLRAAENVDMIIISTMLSDTNGLRLATQFKAIESLRHVPIIMLVEEDDQALMLKALDLGVNDYLIVPIDSNEMMARVTTQMRRKRFQDALKSSYQESMSMAITDGLTKLYNRRYLDTHLANMVTSCLEKSKSMSLIIMDMDHFKSVNDTYGHDVGDEVLRQLSQIIIGSIRSADLAARFGGEEFVVLMPETNYQSAYDVAERMRQAIENTPFIVSHQVGQLMKTVSIGLASLSSGDTPESLLKRADTALYNAKNSGRNQVCPKRDEEVDIAMVGMTSTSLATQQPSIKSDLQHAAPIVPLRPAAPASSVPPIQHAEFVRPFAPPPVAPPIQSLQPLQPPPAPAAPAIPLNPNLVQQQSASQSGNKLQPDTERAPVIYEVVRPNPNNNGSSGF